MNLVSFYLSILTLTEKKYSQSFKLYQPNKEPTFSKRMLEFKNFHPIFFFRWNLKSTESFYTDPWFEQTQQTFLYRIYEKV